MRCTSLLLAVSALLTGCDALRGWVVEVYPQDYAPEVVGTASAGTGPVAVFDGADATRARLNARLRPVAAGFEQITDVQFPPGESERMVVLEKAGKAWLVQGEDRQQILDLPVLTVSEQGLLGLVFHPDFATNGRLFVNAVTEQPSGAFTEVQEWAVADPAAKRWRLSFTRQILQVAQPYANHNAGQLAFGPDGMLYIGFGDGGWRDDPHDNGQSGSSWLGSMLRIDVDLGDPYSVPADNPFIGIGDIQPEIWAMGLRNPWRFSFAPDGRMIIADVGQNTWEEVDLVSAGDNLGWRVREGRRCFPPEVADCSTAGLTDPIYVYGRDEGTSITGGYVVTSAAAGALAGKYLFADFTSGRIWALDLPEAVGGPLAPVYALGRWGMLISTLARDGLGRVYVADYARGGVYRVEG